MGYAGFEELEVWKKSRALKLEIRELVHSFPPEEKYRLTDQLIRSTRSVCTQIAEGHGRSTWPEKIRYCVIARGSLSEVLNHLIDAYDEGYIIEERLNHFKNKITEVEQLLNGYIKYLEKRATTK
jgi:four helix bundle protein